MKSAIVRSLETALDASVRTIRPLSGGCIGDVRAAELADGRKVVVKSGPPSAKLDIEGRMLRDLAERSDLPVPGVLLSRPELLVIDFIESGGGPDSGAERHAAELLASLHGIGAERYGYPYDTLIGSLDQPNPPSDDWAGFFAESRLLRMAHLASEAGRLDGGTLRRIERLADGPLREMIGQAGPPALIHGDIWGGNVLARDGRIAAFIDPAIYHADPEIELAFITLFSTFGSAFFERYGEIRPIRDGFFENRRHLYNLYPLLVHVRLFGGGYLAQVRSTLDVLGTT